jgi:hypothetical protein
MRFAVTILAWKSRKLCEKTLSILLDDAGLVFDTPERGQPTLADACGRCFLRKALDETVEAFRGITAFGGLRGAAHEQGDGKQGRRKAKFPHEVSPDSIVPLTMVANGPVGQIHGIGSKCLKFRFSVLATWLKPC